jgi:tetratricopeptide (TPR) repeat protein
MALLGLFGSDPRRVLDRAAARLARGDATGARELAEPLLRDRDPGYRSRAAEILDEARRALLDSTLARAAEAEDEGRPDDAADWLDAALQYAGAEARPEITARRAALLSRATEARVSLAFDGGGDDDPLVAEDLYALDSEAAFGTLVETLGEDVAHEYAGRPEAFRAAYLALNAGRFDEAREALDALVEAAPDDPVYRLERGRARLLAGDPAGARTDFEAVWESWGDEPLDLAGRFSLPVLWAQALLDLGEAEPVVERLADLVETSHDDPELPLLYGRALLATDRLAEARAALAEAAGWFPRDPDLPLLLAEALARLGRRRDAIACLEAAIAPSCATGDCNAPPLHPPSLHRLVALYVEEVGGGAGDGGRGVDREEALERAGALLPLLARAQGGRLGPHQHRLAARWYELSGAPETAARARAEADRLDAAGGAAGPGEPLPGSPPVSKARDGAADLE